MVEVIYTFKQGRYPFGRGKQSVHTYMEYLLKANDEQQVNKYRQLNSMMKKLYHGNIMHLQRTLKQEMTFHMLYEFHNKSLEQRLKQLTDEDQLVGLFVQLENVFDCLIEKGFKAQLYLEFMGVDEANKLKVWIKPDELQLLALTGTEAKKIKKQLLQYYDTERTRIHLEIEEIFQNSQNNFSKKQAKPKKEIKSPQQQLLPNKTKTPNFVIQGNTLVFLNTSNKSTKQQNSSETNNEAHHMTKAHHLVYEQRPISKTQISSSKSSSLSEQHPDISKMSVAQKVLYYKKLKQQQQSNKSNQLIVKDSSSSNVSQNDLSKSSNNDSNMHIKTQMVNKNKLKIITSQQIQVEGNSDDDLEKLARQKIAKLNNEKQKGKTHDNSTQNHNKSNTSGNSQKLQKYLIGLDQNSREENLQKSGEHSKQINNKIAQAKLKAKNILEKYCQRLKK